jgi:hypothetical protein
MPIELQLIEEQVISILSFSELSGKSTTELRQEIAKKKDNLMDDLCLTESQLQMLFNGIDILVSKYSGFFPISVGDFNKCKTVRDLIALVVLRASGLDAPFRLGS